MTDRTHVLARLAEAFTRREDLSGERHSSFEETVELLEYWNRIEDRQARRRCLSYVKSAAERTGAR